MNKRQKLSLDSPAIYQIKVPGHLGENWADWADSITIRVESNDDRPVTILTGTLDQAALHGLLRRLYALGLPLILVEYLETKKDARWDYEVNLMVSVWQENKALFKALHKAGLSLQALEKLSEFFSLFHMKIQKLEELDEYNQCLVYYLAGGVYMVLNKWFENEMKTPSIEVITDVFNRAASQINQMAKEHGES